MARIISTGQATNASAGTGFITAVGTTISSSQTNGNIVLDANGTGQTQITSVASITNNTASSSITTGSTVISGGLGIEKNLLINGALSIPGGFNFPIGISPATAAAGTFTDVSYSGIFTLAESAETISTITNASGVVAHDFSVSGIWEHRSISGNFTVNLTNAPTTNNRVITINLILVQGSTPYYASALQIGGVGQTIRWSGYTNPVPQANRVELQTFNIIRVASAWSITGTLTSFG